MLNESGLPTDIDEITNRKGYTINNNDCQAISYVKDFLENKTYKEPFTVDSHLISLRDIRKHLSFISAAETRSGRTNWNLLRQITELKNLIAELKNVKSGLLAKIKHV